MKRMSFAGLVVVAACGGGGGGSYPKDLASVDAGKLVVAGVQGKLGTKELRFDRLSLAKDKASVYVVDPKDAKKLLAFQVKGGALTGPSPVSRLGDATSDIAGVQVAQMDFAGLAKAQATCASKYPGASLTELRLYDGYDMVHHEQGAPGWTITFGDDQWCRASLTGDVSYVNGQP